MDNNIFTALNDIKYATNKKAVIKALADFDTKAVTDDEWKMILTKSAAHIGLSVCDVLECIASLSTDTPIDPDSAEYLAYIENMAKARQEIVAIAEDSDDDDDDPGMLAMEMVYDPEEYAEAQDEAYAEYKRRNTEPYEYAEPDYYGCDPINDMIV